jgi:hypothetical protein
MSRLELVKQVGSGSSYELDVRLGAGNSCKNQRRFRDSFEMESGVTRVAYAGGLSDPSARQTFAVICCYLFNFALTFTARRFNLREHFIAGFAARLRCGSVDFTTQFAPDGFSSSLSS